MIEELVNKLAVLQDDLIVSEKQADEASLWIDDKITDMKVDLAGLNQERETARRPYTEVAEELKTTISDLYTQIIDEWPGEKKTMIFDAGTLKFRQTGSLKIHDELYLFSELYDHIKLDVLIEKYLKGFNLTAVKKYMGVHDLPIDIAEIEYTTTAKLEQKSG